MCYVCRRRRAGPRRYLWWESLIWESLKLFNCISAYGTEKKKKLADGVAPSCTFMSLDFSAPRNYFPCFIVYAFFFSSFLNTVIFGSSRYVPVHEYVGFTLSTTNHESRIEQRLRRWNPVGNLRDPDDRYWRYRVSSLCRTRWKLSCIHSCSIRSLYYQTNMLICCCRPCIRNLWPVSDN